MIIPKTPDFHSIDMVELYLDGLPFMASKGEILRAVRELAVEFYKDGYLMGITDQINGDVRMEDS